MAERCGGVAQILLVAIESDPNLTPIWSGFSRTERDLESRKYLRFLQSGTERDTLSNLPKLRVAGSNPVSRSIQTSVPPKRCA
jgi:hypothetical protein